MDAQMLVLGKPEMVDYSPIAITGHWREGHALALHTLSSVMVGQDERGHSKFDTTYSELGALLKSLKYDQDGSAVSAIAEAAADFLTRQRWIYNYIVVVPPSTPRALQPVEAIAEQLALRIRTPLARTISLTRPAAALKNVSDPDERAKLVEGLYRVDHPELMRDKDILVFDDLFRSGTTLNAVVDVLKKAGTHCVDALTITKTRSNR